MTIKMIQYAGRDERTRVIVGKHAHLLGGRDIVVYGCAEGHVKKAIAEHSAQPASVLSTDVKDGPHVDKVIDLESHRLDPPECDVAILSHVLEHCDQMLKPVQRIAKCTRETMIIALPNELDWMRRLHILMGRTHSKYGWPADNGDRHKWFLDRESIHRFYDQVGINTEFEWTSTIECLHDVSEGRLTTRVIERLVRWFGTDSLKCKDIIACFRKTN